MKNNWIARPAGRLSATAIALAIVVVATNTAAAAAKPVKVFILAGQSNMEGKAKVSLLEYQAKQPATRDLFKHLREGRQVDRARRRVDQVSRPQGQADRRLRLARSASARNWSSARSSAITTASRCCSSRRRGAAAACIATSARRAPACRPRTCSRRCSPTQRKKKRRTRRSTTSRSRSARPTARCSTK